MITMLLFNVQFVYKKTSNNKFIFHCKIYIYQRKPKGQPRMDNPELLAILGTQDKEQRQTKQKSLSKKTKKMSNTNHTNTRGRTQVLARVGHFLSLVRHPSCYSYIQDVLDTTMASKHTQHK
jgi:hypothetical protein